MRRSSSCSADLRSASAEERSSTGPPEVENSCTAKATESIELWRPAMATPAWASWSPSAPQALQLGDEPADLAGGDARADGDAADLLDDDRQLAQRVSLRRLHGGVERKLGGPLGEGDDRSQQIVGAGWVRAEAGHVLDIGRGRQVDVRERSRNSQEASRGSTARSVSALGAGTARPALRPPSPGCRRARRAWRRRRPPAVICTRRARRSLRVRLARDQPSRSRASRGRISRVLS